MSKFCPRHVAVFLGFILIFWFLTKPVFAAPCGNGVCQASQGETCSTCPADCGACPTPTPTPAPTATPGPNPTSTPAPGDSTTSPATSSEAISYPSVSLFPQNPDPTNQTLLTFKGNATIERGVIDNVQYSLDKGITWLNALPKDGRFDENFEEFSFIPAIFSEGKYALTVRAKSLAQVFTQSPNYASDAFTVATTAPQVILDKIAPNPTKNQTPAISGRVITKIVGTSKVEISIDGGKSWQAAKLSGNTFSLTFGRLEDGNYPVIARALDSAGNISQSDMQTLIVDLLPPMIGGGMQSIGPQILTPDENGAISIVAGAETTIAMSMKGGVISAEVKTNSGSFNLLPKEGTNIWVGKIKFDSGGKNPLTISAVDGAGNTAQREFNTLEVENSGRVFDKQTNQAVENAAISVYLFETISQTWTLWESGSYGQINPQKTNPSGSYSFILPPGKYYLEAKAQGYKTLQSEVIAVSQTSIVNYPLALTPKAKIEFTLPFIGRVVFTLPSISAPETFPLPKEPVQKQTTENSAFRQAQGTLAPAFSLPNLENKNVDLAGFRGKKLLLSFISPWSSLSLEQALFLSEASLSLPENQAMLVISLQESIASTQTLMKNGNYKFPVVSDKDGITAALYNITILPQHVFIDADGKIKDLFTGVLTKEELMKKLSSMQ